MNISKGLVRAFILLAASGASVLGADMPGPVQASEIKWGPAPPVLPAGAEMAVLAGDPSAGGMVTIRLKMPAGYKIPPHFHPTDEHVTVSFGNLCPRHGRHARSEEIEDAQGRRLRRGGGEHASFCMDRQRRSRSGEHAGSFQDHLRQSGGRSNPEKIALKITRSARQRTHGRSAGHRLRLRRRLRPQIPERWAERRPERAGSRSILVACVREA